MTTNVAVLFSGGGRTVQNLLESIQQGIIDVNISLAIASRSDISGITLLKKYGLDSKIARTSYESLSDGDRKVQGWLDVARPDLICLCGYLRLLHIEPWMKHRVINIHPSLLPKFGGKGMFGMRVHETVIEKGEIETGCTVHYVDEKYDHGPTILQRTCAVYPTDTPQEIANRVFALECEAYPTALQEAIAQLTV